MSDPVFYKTLRKGQRGTHADYRYPVGRWTRKVSGGLVACSNGYHVATADQLLDWLADEVWSVEVEEPQPAGNKWVCRRVRLVERVMTEREVRLFAADCAEHVLPLFEAEYPTDSRPREAIAAARAYADGKITAGQLNAARDAAWAAADAAWDAAGAAADSALAAARDSALVAAADAAWVARDAARVGGGAAEKTWQTNRLTDYLQGRAG